MFVQFSNASVNRKSLLGFYSPPLGAKSFGQMVILRVPPVNMAMKI